jgi:cell division transport system permease protein
VRLKEIKSFIRSFIFSVNEAFISIRNNNLLSMLTTGTIAVAMTFLGFFFLVVVNLGNLTDNLKNRSEMVIFIKTGVAENEVKGFLKEFKNMEEVESTRYVSKEEALQNFKRLFKIDKSVLKLFDESPLPSSIVVHIKENYSSPDVMRKLASEFNKNKYIDEIEYGREWIEKLDAVLMFFRMGIFLIGGLLLAGLIFIVSNTIKLSVYGRSNEIYIMKLVGASPRFIKGPFVIEGMFLGASGSIVSILFLYFGYLISKNYLNDSMKTILGLEYLKFLPTNMLAGMVLTGVAVGYLAAELSVRNLIRIRE